MGGHAIFALMSESSDPLAGAPLAEDHCEGTLVSLLDLAN
jgi:hypothetical protein